jgi:hypothetical protein
VLAESKGLVGGDHPTMLRNGVVGRLAEFLGACAPRAATITSSSQPLRRRCLEPAGFC